MGPEDLSPSAGASASAQILPSLPVGLALHQAQCHRALLGRGAAAPQGGWAREAGVVGGRRDRVPEAGPPSRGADNGGLRQAH